MIMFMKIKHGLGLIMMVPPIECGEEYCKIEYFDNKKRN